MAPQRTCVGCRQRRDDDLLVRLGLTKAGTVRIGRKIPGRGAWLCPNERCLEQALKADSLSRAFGKPVRAGEEDSLKQILDQFLEGIPGNW